MLAWTHIRVADTEPRHTAHVTGLALELFDALHAAAGLPPSARHVLDAACALHDAAFARAPARHPRAAAALVLREGAPGLTLLERRMAALAVLLHGGGWRAEFPRLPAYRLHPLRLDCALRIAAFLRVADALDHSHLQDASIRRIRIAPAGITIAVHCAIYAGNARHANQKADLWNRFCPLPIAFRAIVPPARATLFQSVVAPEDGADCAARRTLLFLYRLVADARQAVITNAYPEALHDLRVAIRRYRTALRFFRPRIVSSSAKRLDRALAALQNRLSPFRDAEVYLRFLEEQRVDGNALRRLRAAQKTRRQRLTALLEAAATRSILLRMAALARVETTGRGGKSFTDFAAHRLRRILERISAHGRLAPDASPETAHALRKIVRRARYYAEMAAPALGAPIARLAGRLKALADALGDAHDADVLAAKVARSFAQDGDLCTTLARQRRRAWADHVDAWRQVADRHFRKKIVHCLHTSRSSAN